MSLHVSVLCDFFFLSFCVSKGEGWVRIKYSFLTFVCPLMPNKYHVLKRVPETGHLSFVRFSVFFGLIRGGGYWAEGARRLAANFCLPAVLSR